MANQPDDRKDRGPEDLGDKEGYDESQRAEILEAEGRGPVKDAVQTDIPPDLGGPDPDEDEIEDEEDDLDIIEDTDAPFRGLPDVGGEEPADISGDDSRIGIQGNENATNRKDTQNTTDR